MGLFWKRKSGDQFISLKLNEPQPAVAAPEQADQSATRVEETASPMLSPEARYASSDSSAAVSSSAPALEPVITGGTPTPLPVEASTAKTVKPPSPPAVREVEETKAAPAQAYVPSRSPFATSVLGLNL